LAVDVSNILDFSKEVIISEEKIKMIGVMVDDNTFLACQVMPFDLTVSSEKFILKDDIFSNSQNQSKIVNDICDVVLY